MNTFLPAEVLLQQARHARAPRYTGVAQLELNETPEALALACDGAERLCVPLGELGVKEGVGDLHVVF